MAREMKDSGIEWIGEIPANWKIGRTKNCYASHKDVAGDAADDYERLALTLNGVIKRPKDDSAGLQPEAFNSYQILRENELVFKLIDLANVATSRVGYSPYLGLVSPAYIVLHPFEEGESKFGVYYFLSMWQREIFNHMGDDGVRSSLNAGDLLNIPYPIIPTEEKLRIVSYLDKECAHIDSTIKQTRASIEEYKKLKQAVITQAVTKGIRPDRQMKDSGIEWIGKMPESWLVLSLKYLCSMQSGKNLVSEQIVETGEYPVYGGNGQRGYFNEYNCEGKKLLIGRQGALCGNVHRADGKFWATEHAVVTENTHFCDMDFLYYLLLGMNLNQHVSSTAAQPGLAVSTIQNVKTCLPSLNEQREIADYLDNITSEIEMLVSKKEELLEDLNNYKKSLIYDYVTGKKEVPA